VLKKATDLRILGIQPDDQAQRVTLLVMFIMLGLAWSLGFLHYFTNMALAATLTQPGTISAHDLSWADYVLDGPNISYPIPSTTLDYNSNSSILISLSNLGPVRCFQNPLPPAPTRFPPVIFNDYWRLSKG